MNRSDILATARDYVTRDRAATHGDAEDQFATIGARWSILIGVSLKPAQVALMMADLKLVRAWTNPAHGDNWIDLAGYAACGGEIATRTKTPNENLSVAAHIARRDAERAVVGAYTWVDGKAVKLDADPQPLEWPADAIGSPPDGVCDVPAPHAAESAEGPPAGRVCGWCYYADFRACCGISGLFVDMDDTCDNWQPRSDLAGLAARDNAIHPKEGRE